MQRYHAANCNSAVNNGALGGRPARDISRAESFLVPPSSYLNSRRSSLTSYNLRCDKEQLNPRIGPPDFHPQTPNCREETLNREYVQFGYRDTVEGLEETREISLSQVQAFTRPPSILKCKEAIRKCHRAINETRAQKRKAGQFYGVPLSGTLIIKPGIFPDQRPCSEDFRKKWFELECRFWEKLPSLNETISIIRAEEGRRSVMLEPQGGDGSALITRTSNSAPVTRTSDSALITRATELTDANTPVKFCTYCKKHRHTRERCWKLHGRPNEKPNRNFQNRSFQDRSSQAHMVDASSMGEESYRKAAPDFNNEEIAKIKTLLGSFDKPTSTSTCFLVFSDLWLQNAFCRAEVIALGSKRCFFEAHSLQGPQGRGCGRT